MTPNISTTIKNFVKETRVLLQDNLVAEYLFGSYAKKQQTELSDVDILLIVKKKTSQIRREISSLASNYSIRDGIIISPIIKDIDIWEKNKKYNTLFFSEIDRYGIKL
jgi:uncharacterized protein